MCDQCGCFAGRRKCPLCDEVGLVVDETPKANPALYDVLSARGKTFVAFTMTPLFLMLWATNVGYVIEISGEEVTLKTQQGQIDYFAVPQHDDFMADYPRDEAVEMARWM